MRRPLAAAVATIIATAPFDGAMAAGCGLLGDLSRSRTLAISLALAGEAAAADAAASDPFVRGLVATITHRPELALRWLRASTESIDARLPPNRRRETIARNGYWSSVALRQMHRPDDAATALAIALEQPDTFYGVLAGGEPGRRTSDYPMPRFDYVDRRATEALVWAITREESRFRTNAVSGAGALGLMQVMPSTANGVTRRVGIEVDNNLMLTDPHYNVAVGSTYLGGLTTRYAGYVPLVAAGYNAGEGCADVWLRRIGDPRAAMEPTIWIEAIPIDETRDYVQRVTASYSVYTRIHDMSDATAKQR